MKSKMQQNHKKQVKEILKRQCADCGKKIQVVIFTDKTYQGGEYFGKIPIHSQKEWKKTLKAGTRKSKLLGRVVDVLKYDPKPYKFVEHWECSKCFHE